jgi:glycosyltransferase involved in cell wall biosynthesis
MKNIKLVIPIYNEEKQIGDTVETLLKYSKENLSQYNYKIEVVDNNSRDKSQETCEKLQKKYPDKFIYTRLPIKGKGIALRTAFLEYNYDYVLFMDCDLATDIKHIKEVFQKFEEGYDMVIGSRLTKGSQILNRASKRGFLSRINVAILKTLTRSKLHDFKCGFKGFSLEVMQKVVPLAVDNNWFFDCEITLLAEKMEYKMFELPVIWTDDPDSKVNVMKVAQDDLSGVLRLIWQRKWTI